MVRPADIGFLRRAAAELGWRHRDGLTLSHKLAPTAWATYSSRKSSVLESPLLSYQPQEGTPEMMMADVGRAAVEDLDLTAACYVQCKRTLRIGDVVRATDAVKEEGAFGIIRKAIRAGTVGIVEQLPSSSSAAVHWTGYFDHPLGLPMVMERADGHAWLEHRQLHGPVQRILPSGEFSGTEHGVVLASGGSASSPAAQSRSPRQLLDPRSVGACVILEAPITSLEVSDGRAWQPMSAATAERRQAMAALHAVGLPVLRRISKGRASGDSPLHLWGDGEGFLRPGADTSMVHDAPVLAYDGAGVGREFNLLYIDEEAEYAVVGMGSASGALYSANVSLRMLPLADVYLPSAKLISPSLPLGRILDGSLGDVLTHLHGEPCSRKERPRFQYKGQPLPPADESLFAMLRGLFGTRAFDGGESTARAWERLRSELVTLRGREAVQHAIDASGTIELPLDLFCVCVDDRRLPVYIDLTKAGPC